MNTTNKGITMRLSIMMFLQFFIWGGWYVTIGNYMASNGMSDLTHWPYTVNPIAAIIAPFFLGLIADRYFPTEKILGVLHLLGAVVMLSIPQLSGNPTYFILGLLLYNLCYMPTLGLSNSLAFSHIQDQEKQFPLIRVFGTIGWIVAGLFVSFILSRFSGDLAPDKTALPMYSTGIASLVLGLFSFTLPHTPPKGKGEKMSARSILGIDAFKQLKSKPFIIFLISSFLICIPLAAYYNFAPILVDNVGFENPAATMSIGQMSEVIFMLLMPLFFVRLGVKKMLLFGMVAWVLRYTLFALGSPDSVTWMIIGGVALHGICYDFFFVTGQIYVDKKADPNIRSQAQGFLVFLTYGVGMLIGAQIAGELFNSFLGDTKRLTPEQWSQFWWIPAAFALAIMIFFALAFKDKQVEKDRELKSAL